jgi:hypothetical protein
MPSLTTKQQTVIALEDDLGFKAFSSPPEAGNAEDLAKQVAARANQGSNSEAKYECATQRSLPVPNKRNVDQRIWLGINNEVPRWVPGSVINFTVSSTGWPDGEMGLRVWRDLYDAALVWNYHNVGVYFNFVNNFQDATFIAVYGGPCTFSAEAPFPNSNDLSFLRVYNPWFNTLWGRDIFIHELGHVLGLRHEFAASEPFTTVPFGPSNPWSVMNYNNPPVLQQSDIDSVRIFYGWKLPGIGRYLIRDHYPVTPNIRQMITWRNTNLMLNWLNPLRMYW